MDKWLLKKYLFLAWYYRIVGRVFRSTKCIYKAIDCWDKRWEIMMNRL